MWSNAIFGNPPKSRRFSPGCTSFLYQSLLPIDHSSATIFLPNSLTTRHSSSFHTFSSSTPLPIEFLTVFDSPPCGLTVSLHPQTIPLLSRCIFIPLPLHTFSSYQSTLAYVSVLIHFAYLDGPGLESHHHSVNFPVDCIVRFSERDYLSDL